MNKFKRFLRTVPMKIYILLAVFIIFAFFSNDFGLVDIQKTAVILAAGVDKKDDTFTLSAQIAVPQSNGTSGTAASTITVSADGENVSDCLSQIFAETGWVPKLVFCELIVLGEEAAKDNAMSCFDFFLRNEYMPDSAHIAVCKGTAKEILSSTSAMDDSPSQAIQRLFTQSAQSSGKVIANTLKQFAIGYYSVSKSGYAPFLRTTVQKKTNAEGGGSESGSASGGKQEENAVVYYADETALFQDGKMVDLLTGDETFAFALTRGKVFAGTFVAEEDGAPVALSVLKNEGNVSLDVKNNPKAELKIFMKLRLFNRGVPAPVGDIAEQTMSDELLKNAEETVRRYLEQLVAKINASECDLFNLKTQLYRKSLRKYAEWKELVPSKIDIQIKTELKKIK